MALTWNERRLKKEATHLMAEGAIPQHFLFCDAKAIVDQVKCFREIQINYRNCSSFVNTSGLHAVEGKFATGKRLTRKLGCLAVSKEIGTGGIILLWE